MTVTYGQDGPVHPGPPPVEPQFPFDEARAALEAIAELGGDLNAMASSRDDAAAAVLDHASGTSIDVFSDRFDAGQVRVRSFWSHRGSALVSDHEWLSARIAEAEAAHDAWVTQRAAWERQLAWHQDWTAANPGVDPRYGPR